jgi:hypothetical protein
LKDTDIPPEAIVAALERMVTTVRENEDPVELKEFRALFKKHVPFNLRGYVTAYMVKELARAGARPGQGVDAQRGQQRRRPRRDAESTAAEPRVERPAEPRARPRREAEPATDGLRRLFVSIGRNRRVQADDLAELIAESVSVERSDLGEIRVLDSYSFVEVPEAVAQDTISALSGTSFKGRRITVDFARARN